MEPSPEILKRKQDLTNDLDAAIRRAGAHARLNHRLSIALMVAALVCSVAAGVGGVFFEMSGKKAGGLAVLPPLIAFVAVNLRFESKSSWHYRKKDGLTALRSRLLYQQPESPSADNIASVARDWGELNATAQKEWDRSLSLNWSGLLHGNH